MPVLWYEKFQVDTVNPIAKVLYESLGFKVFKTENSEIGQKEYLELIL